MWAEVEMLYLFYRFKIRNLIISHDGSISVLQALMLPMIIGFIGLGVEVPTWYSQKGDLQSATDAAAIAIAYQIGSGNSLSTIASNEMSRNGYNANSGITITVNNPPLSGSYAGNNQAVEVIAIKAQAGAFSKLLGMSQLSIRTRAVVLNTPSNNGNGCIMALASSGGYTIDINGNATVNMAGCTMVDNSNNSSAVALNGNATVTVQNIYTAGGISTNGNSTINNSSPNVTNGSVVSDPFSSLPMPSVGSCDQNNFTAQHGNTTMSQGVYCNGINFNAQANVTMNPGIYIVNGGSFNINGGATVTGSGVTIIFTNGATINVNGNSTMTLSAPTSGTYAGILFYGDRSMPLGYDNFNGGASMSLTGTIYMPTQDLNFNGGVSGTATCLKIVSYQITINGGANLSSTCPAGYPGIPVPSGSGSVVLKE